MKKLAIFTLLLALPFVALDAAAASFGDGLEGQWTGSGKAYVNRVLGKVNVRCNLTITASGENLAMDGVCRSGLFKRRLSFSMKSGDGNTYSGTYDGTRSGIATLNGSMSGQQLAMNIAWPKPVHGDKKAKLVLKRTGPDSFSQIVQDVVKGKSQQTSNFRFTRN